MSNAAEDSEWSLPGGFRPRSNTRIERTSDPRELAIIAYQSLHDSLLTLAPDFKSDREVDFKLSEALAILEGVVVGNITMGQSRLTSLLTEVHSDLSRRINQYAQLPEMVRNSPEEDPIKAKIQDRLDQLHLHQGSVSYALELATIGGLTLDGMQLEHAKVKNHASRV